MMVVVVMIYPSSLTTNSAPWSQASDDDLCATSWFAAPTKPASNFHICALGQVPMTNWKGNWSNVIVNIDSDQMETKTHLKRFEIACPAGDSFSQSNLCLGNLSILRMRSVVIMVMIQRIVLSMMMVMMSMVMIIMSHDGITSDDRLVASQPSQCQSPSTPFCTIYPLHAGHTCAMFLVFLALLVF